MTERAPTTTFNHEKSPKEQDPGAAFIDAARELRLAMYENPAAYDDVEAKGDGNTDGPDMFEEGGVDGMYELLHLANEARKSGDVNRELKPYEQTLLDHMQTEAEYHIAQSEVDLDALAKPIDGVDDPTKHRIQEVVDKLRAEDDPANERKIGALETYMGFMDDPDSGHEVRDFVLNHRVLEATVDEQSRPLAEQFAAKTTDELRRVTDHNIISTEAFKILSEHYPGTHYDVSDLEEDPRLEYVPVGIDEEETSTSTNPDNLDDPVSTYTAPAPEAVAPAPTSAEEAAKAAKAERALEREMAEAELAEARAMMAQAARGLFSKSSPELEAMYAERQRTVGKMWLEDELEKRNIKNPTAKQLKYLASLHAVSELNSLTAATNGAIEKSLGAKFANLIDKHPVLMGVGVGGLLTLSGIGIPVAAAGTLALVIHAKATKRTRGMRGADRTVSVTELQNDMLISAVDLNDGSVDRDLLFDAASEHTHDAYLAERHRQRLKSMGIPQPDIERYIKRYTRGLGGSVLSRTGVNRPGTQSQYALAA